ncbi:MAG: NYN domain-containing protein [Anaerolineales bacterium]|nr:NYN domain-containing protein [Anaerolineales bacterium]
MNDQLAVFIDFENVALWAEREFFDFEVTDLMEYLQTRGPAVVKRAYADWSRFTRYRDEMMNNSIDLIQIYSVRTGKNRADIRMAIDAFEIALTRSQIHTYVIVSGDSDFSPLAAKLREYGHYTIGIGPRSVTHDLLVKSCDEFIYLETALGEPLDLVDQSCIEIEQARNLLVKAIQVHGQRGDVPVLATRLKQTMLLMDPAFNEANFGYAQFKNWLEDNRDLLKLYINDLQLYVAPPDYSAASDLEMVPSDPERAATQLMAQKVVPTAMPARPTLDAQYRQLFVRLKVTNVDLPTRRDVLRDIYRELVEHPDEYSLEDLLESIQDRYDAQGLIRTASTLREITQLAFRQQAFAFGDQAASFFTPVRLTSGIESEADFIGRAESDFVFAVIRSGLEIDLEELAYLLLNDRNQADYVQTLLEDLRQRGQINRKGKHYTLPGRGVIPFESEPTLRILIRDMEQAEIPANLQPGAEVARSLAKKAMVQRSQDFAASSSTYLLACRLQWDAVEKGEPGASLEDLRWYMASYASAIAGKLSQVNHDYAGARPYYLAFFTLVQEEDPLWARMRGLINPMLAYYWSNAGRELDINVSTWNLSMSSPAQIAVYAATHPNPDLRKLWQRITLELARVNPSLLRRISNQLMLNRADYPDYPRVAEQIESILSGVIQA